jgi:hypothetical protein
MTRSDARTSSRRQSVGGTERLASGVDGVARTYPGPRGRPRGQVTEVNLLGERYAALLQGE